MKAKKIAITVLLMATAVAIVALVLEWPSWFTAICWLGAAIIDLSLLYRHRRNRDPDWYAGVLAAALILAGSSATFIEIHNSEVTERKLAASQIGTINASDFDAGVIALKKIHWDRLCRKLVFDS